LRKTNPIVSFLLQTIFLKYYIFSIALQNTIVICIFCMLFNLINKIMKKILFLFSILLIGLGVKAQGSLQFNQVVVINNGVTYTVPAGKVFKIESLNNIAGASAIQIPLSGCTPHPSIYGDESVCNYAGSVYMTIDNLSFSIGGNSLTVGGLTCACPATNLATVNVSNSINLPIWLDAGKTVAINSGNGIQITGLEFNIIT